MILTPAQIRAALGLLGMTQKDLSDATGITRANLNKYNNQTSSPTTTTMQKITDFFDNKGVQPTINGGYEFKPFEEIRKLHGEYGFISFMDDVYEVMKNEGGEVCVSNVDERNWIKWMGETRYKEHSKRMAGLSGYNFKIFIKEGDDYFIASDFAEYRYVSAKNFSKQSFYVYDDRLAIITFKENDVNIKIIHSEDAADSFRCVFNELWEKTEGIK